jgi:hypothetical protein
VHLWSEASDRTSERSGRTSEMKKREKENSLIVFITDPVGSG